MSMAGCTCDHSEGVTIDANPLSILLTKSGKTQQIEAGFYLSGAALRNAILTR